MPDQRRPDDVCWTLRPAVTLREELAKQESFDSLPVVTLRSLECSLLKLPQKAPQKKTHAPPAQARRRSHCFFGIPMKRRKRPSRRTTCDTPRLRASAATFKESKAPRVGWFRMLVLPGSIGILPKSDVKIDVGLRWQGLAGRGKSPVPQPPKTPRGRRLCHLLPHRATPRQS